MADGIFSYNEATAEASSSSIGSVIAGLESTLSDLGGFVAAVKSAWEGDEQDTYAGVQAKWDSAANTVSDILDAVSKSLSTTTSGVKDMRSRVRGALVAS
ncbi:Proteins of 100 residues with WXG [Nakamurella panacisegetis]|uniref:Proteins of 100 residues with WXG n=1 Tax=Nakamurella panacisegetis TaxID=1090615 RepID=A0A1H0PMY7_9ACTN|nr:WXG100 family type VII secretion target [Nakamurella panacisegetis]SDP06015.1 Proteins of 100 residues with WXG [Nakamurella panacisegetis]